MLLVAKGLSDVAHECGEFLRPVRRVAGAYTGGAMRTDDLDFDLPPELIAQTPAPQRSASRLLLYRREDRSIRHRAFAELPDLLRPGDLLVFNDARVLP